MRTGALAAIAALAGCSCSRPGRRAPRDVGSLGGSPLKLDATDTSIVAQHFDYRTCSQQLPGRGAFVKRSARARSRRTAGGGSGSTASTRRCAGRIGPSGCGSTRSSTGGGPSDNPNFAIAPHRRRLRAERSLGRQRVALHERVYPAKLWLTYRTPGIEITAGDSYVQFGRGLVLSMRKVDELGDRHHLFGGKVRYRRTRSA